MDDQGRWVDPLDAERDREAEHREAVELARRERLDEKGLPHAYVSERVAEVGGEEAPALDRRRPGLPEVRVGARSDTYACEPCECGGLCDECEEAA